MRTRIRHVVLCIQGAVLLAGCAMLQKDEPQALKVMPAQTVRHGAARAEAQYALGRYYRGLARYEQAAAALREALQANPEHAEARDALAVLLASQGRHEEAIGELEKAVASAPRSASIRNNLGYAYLLRGRSAEAVATLEMAAALDPANARVRDNLQMAQASAAVDEKIAQLKVEVAQANTAQANLAQKSVMPAAVAAAPPSSSDMPVSPSDAAAGLPARPLAVAEPPPAPHASQAVLSEASGTSAPEPSSPVAGNDAVVQAPAPLQTPVLLSPPVAVSAVKKARLEVSNGNGVTGMAQATARQFRDEGYARPRLTNEAGFRLPTTEIQYRPGFEQQARALQALLRPSVPISESPRLRSDVQVRLALGKDATSVAALVVAQQPAPLRVAVATGQ